jgi:hypothetical protein
MAQDERKGQPPSTRGRSPAPPAPDTPDTRDINAPPPPEEPVTQPTDAGPPAASTGEANEDANEESGARGIAPTTALTGSGGQGDGEAPPADQTDTLQDAVEDAKRALKEKEEALARYREQREVEKAETKLVNDYEAEVDALKLADEDLEDYRQAEISFLSRFLDQETKDKIADAAKTAQAEIDTLADEIKDDEATAAAARNARDDAKEAAVKARTEADALKRPGGSIRDRLKAADAIRSEAKKASDDGKYALAYWLVMPGGKLDQALRADPPIFDPDDLRELVKTAREAQEDAEKTLADRETELKAAEDKLRAKQVALVDLRKKFDATVLANVAELNPTIVKAA